MKKLPILAICDDACTAKQHMTHRDATTAMLAYGETYGSPGKILTAQRFFRLLILISTWWINVLYAINQEDQDLNQ